MNPIDTERAIAVELNLAESELASVAARLAKIDALADDAFEANYDAAAVAKAADKGATAMQIIARAKLRLSNLHAALLAASNTATFPRPRSGK
jgi:hypothetical protein